VAIERLVIVADAHLGGVPAGVEAAFLEFLDAVPSLGDGLLINGDLFAFWFAYRRAIPREGIAVLARLAALARIMPVAMTGGNHDRWGDSFWEQELGIRFSPDELRIPLAVGAALAVHGDGVAEVRWPGRLLHSVFRHPVTSGGLTASPAGWRIPQGIPPCWMQPRRASVPGPKRGSGPRRR
jgi:UDP-2,3-diacylglucosamine hydrolase